MSGPRKTDQRTAILDALTSAQGPLTPFEVHERARVQLPSLGRATVYRNLTRLADEGDVVAVHLPGDATRYEPAGRGHHHHFRCTDCDGVFEFDAHCPVAVLEGVTLPGGFQVTHHELTLYGLCATCGDAGGP